MEGLTEQKKPGSAVQVEMPWEDFEDGGGYDDDASLMGKPATFADLIREAGFRELLSPSTVQAHIDHMIRDGLLTKQTGLCRTPGARPGALAIERGDKHGPGDSAL